MTRVILDPRLLATGIAYAGTPARQLLVMAAWGKLRAAVEVTDADLAAAVGGTLMGAPGLVLDDISSVARKVPDGVPDDLTLVSSEPLLDATVNELTGFFANYPPLRVAAAGVRPEPLIADLVAVPRATRETQDQLLYCGLEAGDVVVSDSHPIVVASRGARTSVHDRLSDRSVDLIGFAALAAEMGAGLRAVPEALLADICALLRPPRRA